MAAPPRTESFRFTINYDVLPIQPGQREACQQWLQSVGFLVPGGPDEAIWSLIKTNWSQFVYRPYKSRSPVRRWQLAFWDWIDRLEGLSERWPPAARRTLNECGDGPGAGVFTSLAPKWELEKRRRLQTIWTSLVGFLLHSYETDSLPAMGLDVGRDPDSESSDADEEEGGLGSLLLDVVETLAFTGDKDHLEIDTFNLLWSWVGKGQKATVHNNALLWWMAVLVRSALSAYDGGEDDFISRGRSPNIIAIDVDLLGRVEAIRHYSKVLVLDQAFRSWKALEQHRLRVIQDLDKVDIEWVDGDSGVRPDDSGDHRLDNMPIAWKRMLEHLWLVGTNSLGGEGGTVMCELNNLYRGLTASER